MLRSTTLLILSSIILLSTGYSSLYNTYLDTSNPLLTHLPHPLHKTHYFAAKSNWLNVIFIKRAWGWTTVVFLLSWITASQSVKAAHLPRALAKWAVATASWLLFTTWFFGPALFERFIAASGGECILALPSGETLPVPQEYCYSKSTISLASHPDLFSAAPSIAALVEDTWSGAKPRLRRGHDVSGHIFLLALSVLFLVDQLRPSLRSGAPWSFGHKLAVGANAALVGLWLFAIYTTSVYFHSPGEKISGYLLGLASFALTQLPVMDFVFPPAKKEKIRSN